MTFSGECDRGEARRGEAGRGAARQGPARQGMGCNYQKSVKYVCDGCHCVAHRGVLLGSAGINRGLWLCWTCEVGGTRTRGVRAVIPPGEAASGVITTRL